MVDVLDQITLKKELEISGRVKGKPLIQTRELRVKSREPALRQAIRKIAPRLVQETNHLLIEVIQVVSRT